MGEMHALLEALRAELGEAAMRRLVARAGGMRLYVPTPERAAGSVLAGLAGPTVAAWLADRYAGEPIDLPSARAMGRLTDAAALKRAVAAEPDTPVNLIAHRHGVSARRVLQLRAELRCRHPEAEPPLLALLRNASSDRRG